jgi:hypothetical protein
MSTDDEDTLLNPGPEPTESAAAGSKIRVSLNGVEQGWATEGGPPYYSVIVTPNEAEATIWTRVNYNGRLYIGKLPNQYWSSNRNDLVVVRVWAYAAGWRQEGGFLRCLTNGNLLGIEGNMLYVNNKNVVTVDFVGAG